MDFQNDAPIVQKLYDFYQELYLVIEKMPKKDKYSLGEKLQKTSLDLLELLITVSTANKEQKLNYLTKANTKLDLLRILLRLSCAVKAVPTKKYLRLTAVLQETGKMLGGWIRSLR